MRVCIHSSNYDPAFHRIISGPYSSPDACSGPCGASAPTTTTTSTTTSVPSPSVIFPPIHFSHTQFWGNHYPINLSGIKPTKIYNLNNFTVIAQVEYLTSFKAKKYFSELQSDRVSFFHLNEGFSSAGTNGFFEIPPLSVASVSGTIVSTKGNTELNYLNAAILGEPFYARAYPEHEARTFIRAKCSIKGAGNLISDWSYSVSPENIFYTATSPTNSYRISRFNYSNFRNVKAPLISRFTQTTDIYNSNDFDVTCIIGSVDVRYQISQSEYGPSYNDIMEKDIITIPANTTTTITNYSLMIPPGTSSYSGSYTVATFPTYAAFFVYEGSVSDTTYA